MSRVSNFFKKIIDWLFVGKRLPIIIAAFVIIAVSITAWIVIDMNKVDPYGATVFVTIKGFDNDFENRQIKIETNGDTVKEIFSLKYPEVYEAFGKPFIHKNVFSKFMNKKATPEGAHFQVTIDGDIHRNLENAYVFDQQTIVIEYKPN